MTISGRSLGALTALLCTVALAAPIGQAHADQAIIYVDELITRDLSLPLGDPQQIVAEFPEAVHTPNPDRSYNGFSGNRSASDVQVVVDIANEGYYYVGIPGASLNSGINHHVIVQAVGTDNARCQTGYSGYYGFISVRCSKPTRFVMRVADFGSRPDSNAFYLTTQGNPEYSSNREAQGAEFDITRESPGVWEVDLPNLGKGTAHVTVRDPSSAEELCTVDNKRGGAEVRCFYKWDGIDWQPYDSAEFTLIFEEHEHSADGAITLGGGETRLTANPSYYPMIQYHMFNGTQVPYAMYAGAWMEGLYINRYSGIPGNIMPQMPMFVTATHNTNHSDKHYCKPAAMPANGGSSMGYAYVRCFDEDGNPAEGTYNQSLFWWL